MNKLYKINLKKYFNNLLIINEGKYIILKGISFNTVPFKIILYYKLIYLLQEFYESYKFYYNPE